VDDHVHMVVVLYVVQADVPWEVGFGGKVVGWFEEMGGGRQG